jgi:hypothetical protein
MAKPEANASLAPWNQTCGVSFRLKYSHLLSPSKHSVFQFGARKKWKPIGSYFIKVRREKSVLLRESFLPIPSLSWNYFWILPAMEECFQSYCRFKFFILYPLICSHCHFPRKNSPTKFSFKMVTFWWK